jgi:Putative zinc-finger
MDHDEAVRLKATERYLLQELDAAERDQFEDHLFDCQECALDVRAAAMFVEQSKVVLAEPLAAPARVARPIPSTPKWMLWFRPAFVVPVMAILIATVAYQSLVQVPHLELAANQPQVLPYASLNVSTRGTVSTHVSVRPGQSFDLLVSIPPEKVYSTYIFELYNPAGKLEWSLQTPASSPDDTRSIHIPGNGLEQGTYKLIVKGIGATGQGSDLGSYPVELEIQK